MSDPGEPSTGGRTAAFGFIFVSAVVCAMSIGIMVPVLPNLLKSFNGGDTAAATDWSVAFFVFGGLMSFFAGPVLGLLSDRYGRRPVLLFSLAGLGLDFVFMAFAPSIGWLFVGRLISGATSGVFSTANAYVADVTPPERRARAFGWMGAAFSVGFLLGPAIGGLLGDYNLRLPFMAAAVLTLVNALYGLIVVPESLPPSRRTAAFHWRRANPLGALRLLRSHHELLPLAAVGFLNQLANMVWPSVFVLYAGYRFHWTPGFTGVAMACISVAGVLVQSFIVGPAVKRFGERGCLLIGASLPIIGLAWASYAPNGWLYFLGVPFNAFWQLLVPGLQGLMTRRVGPTEQGQLQGANQSLAGMASVLGPVLYGLSFAWAVRHPEWHIPGLPFLLASLTMVACLVIAILAGRAAQAHANREAAE
ncbi:MAG TPA: TCR/Tet family MFS transporter [Rhizomicrobium sp.]|jgi:DHA1 family tetracycline resistance protein-like MFS transporter|nr:TCR/Tet family MFS transporter [Rhizomicrobium sp.]